MRATSGLGRTPFQVRLAGEAGARYGAVKYVVDLDSRLIFSLQKIRL